MSTYPTTIRSRVSTPSGPSLAMWAALGLAMIGAVLVLILAVPSDDKAPTQSQAVTPDSRFDGGPNEGTRGAVNRSPADSAVIRFDGGPQEGTRGAIASPSPVQAPTLDRGPRAGHVGDVVVSRSQIPSPTVSSSSTRFDGGPQEGTRGAAVQSSPTARFDGGPNEGTRGR